MPELPEVETVRRTLWPHLKGQTIVAARVLEPRLVQNRSTQQVEAMLVGQRIAGLSRRAKYLLFHLSGGSGFVLHLRMTGQLIYFPVPSALGEGDDSLSTPRQERRAVSGPGEETPDKTDHVRMVLHLSRGRLELRDQRRFATLHWLEEARSSSLPALLRLGIEPLTPEFQPERLAEIFARRRAPIKSVLLNQECVAGLGNIYADEALFRAGIHPQRPACRLEPEEIRRLRDAVTKVLREALDHGGTSVRNYRNGSGQPGSFQRRLRVYGREGLPCENCGSPIRRIRLAGRSSWFCEGCQG